MAAFELTPAEADLAADLLAGLSVREIAAGSGRSIATVRTHLANLLAKTGFAQAELNWSACSCACHARRTADGTQPRQCQSNASDGPRAETVPAFRNGMATYWIHVNGANTRRLDNGVSALRTSI